MSTKLQRMQWLATGLLVLAALVYATATVLEPRHAWLHYVRAASEAAMVGAIADWFAVVSLFRHPFNLRFIPHTAVIPANRARIAAGLAEFIQQNFLSTPAIVARIAQARPALTLCRWLLRPENSDTVAGYCTRLLAFALAALDDERVRRFLQRTVTVTLGQADVAGAAAQVLDVLTTGKRHHALLEEALAGLDEILSREETRRYIAAEIAHNAPLLKAFSDLLNLKLDEKAALRLVDIAIRKIAAIRQDQGHELRERFDAYVAGFIDRLKQDDALRQKAFALRDEALANPALAGYVATLWQAFRSWLGADLASGASLVHARIAEAALSLGRTLEMDAGMRDWIDEQIARAVPAVVEEHRAGIGRFVEDQINGWRAEKLVAEMERHLGADLQYIRINGTLVGALAGLLIAALTELAR